MGIPSDIGVVEFNGPRILKHSPHPRVGKNSDKQKLESTYYWQLALIGVTVTLHESQVLIDRYYHP